MRLQLSVACTAALLSWLPIGAAFAQGEGNDHGAHHPEATATPPAAGVPVVPSIASPPQSAGECSGMMGCMGGAGRPFYASLLDMPVLTAAARRTIEAEAERRIGSGSQAITSGQARLHQALAANDTVAVQQVAAGLREGLSLLESGMAARRAVEAGMPPRQLAMTWFRDQLGLPAIGAEPTAMVTGLWGLSWYHLTSMAFLVAFLLGTLLIQQTRMRRVSALVQRLSATPAAPVAPASRPPIPAPVQPMATSQTPSPAAATAAARRPWSGRLHVAAIFAETPSVKTFRLVAPDGDIPFVFMPGQFLTISAEIDGQRARRSYTIASSPTQRSYVEVTIKREEQGLISRHLHDQVAVDSELEVSAPLGVFTFTGAEADSIVLIAGGVGITPMMSVIRFLTDRSFPGDIHFLYGARTTQDFIFGEELEYLQKRHPRLHVAATMSRAEGTAWMGSEGPISKEFIARTVPDIARRRVHLCGPPPMMEAVKAALAELGVPSDQVKTEAFGPARGVAPGTPAPLPVGMPAPASAATPAPPPAAALAVPRIATAEVRFTKSGRTAALAPDQTVLEAAEAVGVGIDYSCRVGICGACKVPLLKGEVTMEVEEGLPPEEKGRGIILACQAKSVGNLDVEA